MVDPILRVVLLPRYTALYGASLFRSAPLNVRGYCKALISAWRGTGLGSTPATVDFQLEQSTDLGIWHPVSGTFTPASPDQEETVSRDLYFEWVRLTAQVAGTAGSQGVTVWAVGAFIPRESSAG